MSTKSKIIPLKRENKPSTRGGVLKYIGLAIITLAVISLVFSSLLSGLGGQESGKLAFGRYGDKDIVYSYNNSFGQAVNYRMDEYDSNDEVNNQFFDFFRRMVWQQEFSNAVVRTAIVYHLEESGYSPSSRAIDRRMVNLEPFQTKGQFDKDKYNQTSVTARTSLRENLREHMALEIWTNDTHSSLYRSDTQLEFLGEMRASTQTYDYISLPFIDYPAQEVLVYAKEHAELFRTLPISRITVEDEQIALDVMNMFNEQRQDIGAFSALAQEYSTDSYKEDGGNMESTEYYKLLDFVNTEVADQVFALASGEIAGPFDTEYGWIIFHADGELAEADLEAIVDDVRHYMLQNEVGTIEESMLSQAGALRSLAVSSESFRDTMEAENLEVATTLPFSINYGGDSLLGDSIEKSDDTILTGTTSSEDFWNTIASLQHVGEISQPIVLSEAIGLFALASTEIQEKEESWDMIVPYELSNSIQTDFQAIILSEDSRLLVDKFSKTYANIFQ